MITVQCDKICKSKGGLTTGLSQDTVASIVETLKKNIIKENIYDEEINMTLKTASVIEALFEAIYIVTVRKFL